MRAALTRGYPETVSGLICVMALLLILRCIGAEAYRAAVAPGPIFTGDFKVYYEAAQRVEAGQPLYMPEHGRLLMQHVSSPLIPLVVRPLTHFPLETATRIWAAINVGLLTLAVFLFCWGTGLRIPDNAVPVLLLLFCGFRFWPTTIELGIGNSDMLLLMLVSGMFVCARYGKWVLFAALVAVAALTKTWMIGMLFYLIIRRRWGAVVCGVCFFAAGLAILFSAVGWREWSGWIQVTHQYSSQPMLISNSVAGIARMYFTENRVLTPLVESRVCWTLVMVLGYGTLLGGLGRLWWRGGAMDEAHRQMSLGLTALALILGSPVSHLFYFVLALPVLWLLLTGKAQGWEMRVGAFVVYLLYSIPYPGLNPAPEAMRHGIPSLRIGESFFCGMILWGLGLYSALRGCRVAEVPVPAIKTNEAFLGGLDFLS